VPGTPLSHRPPAPFIREHRLYQADFLLRRYGFAFDELCFEQAGALPTDRDPKTAWAEAHPERFPVEVNTAPPERLLRVPGIGPRSTERLIRMRRASRLKTLAALRAAGASTRAAAPYVLLDGRRAAVGRQLRLFD
jgi:predicted DNA-binding helix-hairpin-helix protein